jgi:Flp pilus assembly pilin Flp
MREGVSEMLRSSLKRSRSDEIREDSESQPIIQYTLLVVLIALVFWLAVIYANAGSVLSDGWSKIAACLSNTFSCGSAS